MARRDEYLNAMLRHLGAAYYDSLHGRATRADVSRALDAVEEHNGQLAGTAPAGHPAAAGSGTHGAHSTSHASRTAAPQHHGRWHQRVRDVMSTQVITVDRITPYKEIAALLAEHKIGLVPVLILGRHVTGVVSEADLLAAQDTRERAAQVAAGDGLHFPHRDGRHSGLTAEELMTSPAITIHPDATLPAAARLMNSHHLEWLPVVNPDGTLAGLVSRGDLLSVFLRSDEDIARQVRELLDQVLLTDPASITVRVRNGIVTLTGQPSAGDSGLIRVAIRLTWDIDGVVDLINKIGAATSP
jgi:CBS domain-containing protein